MKLQNGESPFVVKNNQFVDAGTTTALHSSVPNCETVYRNYQSCGSHSAKAVGSNGLDTL